MSTPAETTATYAGAVAEWDRLREERQAEQDRHEREVRRLDAALSEAERVMGLVERVGEDVAASYVVARDLLLLEWGKHRPTGVRRVTPEVTDCFTDAVQDLRQGGERLSRGYFGVKAYEGWASQREDHEYGFGPAHGSIWFRIGLRRPRVPLSEAERVACIRWLRAVQEDPAGTLR